VVGTDVAKKERMKGDQNDEQTIAICPATAVVNDRGEKKKEADMIERGDKNDSFTPVEKTRPSECRSFNNERRKMCQEKVCEGYQ
jgi:hypothetical protein